MAPKRKAEAPVAPEGTRKSRRLEKQSPEYASGLDSNQKDEPAKKTVPGKTLPIDVYHFQKPAGVTEQEWKRMLGTLSSPRLAKLCRALGISIKNGTAKSGKRTTASKSKLQMATAIVEALACLPPPKAAVREEGEKPVQGDPIHISKGVVSAGEIGSSPSEKDEDLQNGNAHETFNRRIQYWRARKKESRQKGYGFPKRVDTKSPVSHDLSLDQVAVAIQCLTESTALRKYHSFIDDTTWAQHQAAIQYGTAGPGDNKRIHRPRRRLVMPWLVSNAVKAAHDAAAEADKMIVSKAERSKYIEQVLAGEQAKAHIFLVSVTIPYDGGDAEDPEETFNPSGIPQLSWYDSGERFVGFDGSDDRNNVLSDIRAVVDNLQWYTYPIARSTKELAKTAPWLAHRKIDVPEQSNALRGCGILAVLNGWAVALGLTINPSALIGRSNRDLEKMMNEALELMELLTSGNLDTQTIFVYFRRWKYITKESTLPTEYYVGGAGLFYGRNAMEYADEGLNQETAIIMSLDPI